MKGLAKVFFIMLGSAALLSLSPGCGSTSSGSWDGATKWIRTEIFCGLDRPGGGKVSDAEFADFLNTEVTPRFPAGLTVYDTYGQMQKSDKSIVHQETGVILLVHENTKAMNDAAGQVVSAYRSRFGNPQVMRLSQPTTPEFFGD